MADKLLVGRKTIFAHADENPLEGIASKKSGAYTGMESYLSKKMTPYDNGHSYFYWIHLPFWFEQDEDLKYFKAYFEKFYLSVQGITDIQLQTSDINIGVTGRTQSVVTGIDVGNTTFTVEHQAMSGSPLTKCYRKWINYICDNRAGIATYAKLFNCDYAQRNHTGECIYIQVRADANNVDKDIVEFAIYWSSVFPKTIPQSQYNYNRGESSLATITQEFSGIPEMGPAVDEWAREILKNHIICPGDREGEAGSYDVIDSMGAYDTEDAAYKVADNANLSQSEKEIYNR